MTADADFYALELLLDDGDRALLHRVRDFMSFRQGGLPWGVSGARGS